MAIQISTEQIKNLGVTNAKIANSTIANAKLANSTISGIALGSNLASLTAGNGLSMTGYNGSAAISDLTIDLDGATLAVGGSGIKVNDGGITNTQISGSAAIADSKLATIATSNKVSGSAVQLATATALEDSSGLRLKAATAGDGLAISASQVMSVTVDDSSIEIDSDSLRIKALGVTGSMIANSTIANGKLANSTVSFGGISLALGSSDATPAFDLQHAVNYPFSSLTGSIANSQISAGSISFDKLADSANICRLDQAETVAATYTFTAIPQTSVAPTATGHLCNKQYVDSVATGLDLKGSCKVATTATITLSGTQTIDGVSVAADDRVLVKNQSSASQNGIYLCKAGSWVRSDDMAAGSDGAGAFTFIEQGTANGDAGFVCTSDSGAAVVGTNVLAFTQFSKSADITAGQGLVKNGNAFDVNAGDGIAIASDAVKVDLATNPGLQFTSNKLDLKLQANLGLMKDANGVKVDFDNTSLGIIANKLAMKDNAVSFAKLSIQPYTDGAAGDGSTVDFVLSNRLDTTQLADFKNCIRVYRNGLRMQHVGSSPSGQDQYSTTDNGSATVIRFGTAPNTGDTVIIDYWA